MHKLLVIIFITTKIFFFKNYAENEAERLVPAPLVSTSSSIFFCFLKKLYIR